MKCSQFAAFPVSRVHYNEDEKGKSKQERKFGMIHFSVFSWTAGIHPAALSALCGLAGMLIGRLLGVAAQGLLRKESLLRRFGRCPHCRLPQQARAFLPLHPRCRRCRRALVPLSPAGELMNGAAFALLAWKLGMQPELAAALVLACVLTTVTLTDLMSRLVPDKVILFALLAGLLLRIWIHPLPFWNYLAAMLMGFALLYAIGWLGYILLRKESMGGGDMKLFLVIGLYMGVSPTLFALLAAIVYGAVVGLMLLAAHRTRDGAVPFVPFIYAGVMTSFLYGEAGMAWYMRLLT